MQKAFFLLGGGLSKKFLEAFFRTDSEEGKKNGQEKERTMHVIVRVLAPLSLYEILNLPNLGGAWS